MSPAEWQPRFRREQEVKIRALDVKAFIDAVMDAENGFQYRVIFWLSGDRKNEWLYEWELEALAG